MKSVERRRIRTTLFIVLFLALPLLGLGCGGGGGGGDKDSGSDGETFGGGVGIIQGVVTDTTTQNPCPNAIVSAQNTSLQTTTDSQGQYTLHNVPTGGRSLLATAAGYSPQSNSVTVVADTTVTLNFSLTPLSAGTNVYYVATNGSDANPGTQAQPWRTIGHAADTATAGDTVYIRGGEYNEAVHTMNSGSAIDGYIVYSASPGETPIIDGTGVDASNGFIIDQSYIKLLGLEIRDWETGIWIEYAANFEIADCVVHNVVYGIGVAAGSHDFVFNRVEVHHFDLYGFDVSPVGIDCYNGTFNDCVAHTRRDPQQNVDGFALGHGDQYNFVFNRCETYDVFDGFDISARDTTLNRCSAYDSNSGFKIWEDNVKLVNCLSYNNEGANLELDWDGDPGTTTLQNCTLMDAASFSIWVENSGDSLHMYNTIVAGGDNIGLAFEQMGVGNYRGDYNVFHNDNPGRAIAVAYTDEFTLAQVASGAWTTYSGQDAHSLVVNSAAELFVDPTNFDLHLTATSAALDKGASAGAPSEDYDGNSRPQGTGYDIGAYER